MSANCRAFRIPASASASAATNPNVVNLDDHHKLADKDIFRIGSTTRTTTTRTPGSNAPVVMFPRTDCPAGFIVANCADVAAQTEFMC